MYTKKNGRVTFKSNRRPNYKRNNNYGSKGRNKGSVTQQYNKYLKLANDTFSSGDRIQAEYYYQFTDHYYRLMVELGINIEDNTNVDEAKESSIEEPVIDNQTSVANEVDDNNSNDESIESIPFIAEPSKDKRTRTTQQNTYVI